MFKLVIQDDEGKTTVVPLIRDEITIGRKEGNTIRLTERNVSRRHARILRNNGEVHIEDLGSYNGIRVNNARIAERVSLRVSDQVQIGDYKLFLKAEGLEQGDANGMTQPLDRTEPEGVRAQPMTMAVAVAPPDALAVTPAATQPHPAVSALAPTAPAPVIVGSPNRTLVALPDGEARTIGPATQEAIDALKRTAGYGKLVVLSSNFAGKEFELSRPQMIIGRTDENDIVINHRSISRNHAKVVREPETSRYTISDLQSSNGVRVNGQDYGKVELRRGDVVDLGHVRLRFVEAGEDFVFARDAVITDVPEAGGKRGMLMAIIAAVLVVAAGVVVYLMHSSPADKPAKDGSAAPAAPGSGSDLAAAAPPTPDAPDDNAARTAAATPEHAVAADNPAGKRHNECLELKAAKKWQDLLDCGKSLSQLGDAKGDEFQKTATGETKNEATAAGIRGKIGQGSLREAQVALKAFPPDSVYAHDLNDAFEKADLANLRESTKRANGFLNNHNCDGLKKQLQQDQTGAEGTERVIALVQQTLAKCNAEKAAVAPPPTEPVARPPQVKPPTAAPATSGGTPANPPAANKCDQVDDWVSQAANQYNSGYAQAALSVIAKAIACKSEVRLYRLAALYACAAHDSAAAKMYFAKIPSAFQPAIEQKCQQEHTDLGITPQ